MMPPFLLLWVLSSVCLPALPAGADGVFEEGALKRLVLPPVACHDSLCNLQQGVYVKDENVTRIFVPVDLADEWEQLCISTDGLYSDMFCFSATAATTRTDSASVTNAATVSSSLEGWMDLPLVLTGRQTLTIRRVSMLAAVKTTQNVYFIQQVQTFPAAAWLWSDITYPSYGALIDSRRFLLKLQPSTALLRSQDHTSVLIRLVQVRDLEYAPTVDTLDTLGQTAIEPGSYFVDIGPPTPGGDLSAVHSSGYMEHVLAPDEIKENRRYFAPHPSMDGDIDMDTKDSSLQKVAVAGEGGGRATKTASKPLLKMTLGSRFSSSAKVIAMPTAQSTSTHRKQRICMWTSDVMDGQKNIWLQQMLALNRSEYAFTCILSGGDRHSMSSADAVVVEVSGRKIQVSRDGFALKVLHNKLADLALNPDHSLPIEISSLDELPGDGSPPFSALWDHTERGLMAYLVERLELFQGMEEHMTPLWARRFTSGMLDFTRRQACDVMVYGNDRESSPDAMIPALGLALRIPTVSELLNLFVSTIPNVIVGPSHFATEHPTVRHAGSTENYQGFGRPKTASIRVISPGVNTSLFDPALYRGEGALSIQQYHDKVYAREAEIVNVTSSSRSRPPFVIGFVGRLSVEKNVGLFLLAAQRILETCLHCRFTVVGAGALREKLELLCAQLDIAWAVHFAGWQHETSLPSILAGMDVVVNPSLRAWSETFCIVNIEVLAMQKPLITFAVGGVGEYVRDPRSQESTESAAARLDDRLSASANAADLSLFSVGANAIVLSVASPLAIERAVQLLLRVPELATALGEAGRRTVQTDFTLERQIQQYDQLYKSL